MNWFKSINYWKLAIFKVSGKALVALFTSIVASLNGAQWSQFTSTEKFVAIACGIAAMWNVVDAFLSDTMAKLRAEQPKQE